MIVPPLIVPPLIVPGQTVLVCGAGVAGRAVARVLLRLGATVLLCDRERNGEVAELEQLGVTYVGDVDVPPPGTQLVVSSPGWSMDRPIFTAARTAGISVVGEIELAWRLRAAGAPPWLAVTGTNGKTTTVRMLESILRAAGLSALAVGNVGIPVIDAVVPADGVRYDVLAVELSSYQLAWSTVRPAAGALLNLAPDHLDWHGSMDAYAAAKAGVWAGEVALGNSDDSLVADLLERSAAPRKAGFTLQAPAPGQLGVRAGILVDRAFSADPAGTELIAAADVRPLGSHNVANALAAAGLARAYAIPAAAVAAGLRAFVPDRHRNELVATVHGVSYVDDSKATNPHAAQAALAAYPRVVWIAGGQLKGVDIDPLVRAVADRPDFLAGAVLLGVDRAQIAEALTRHAPNVPVRDIARTDHEAMLEVTAAAAGLARPGDTVLLSPAAASYDMFDSYAQRGDLFAAAVHTLGGRTVLDARTVDDGRVEVAAEARRSESHR